jgi:hypothetical protein
MHTWDIGSNPRVSLLMFPLNTEQPERLSFFQPLPRLSQRASLATDRTFLSSLNGGLKPILIWRFSSSTSCAISRISFPMCSCISVHWFRIGLQFRFIIPDKIYPSLRSFPLICNPRTTRRFSSQSVELILLDKASPGFIFFSSLSSFSLEESSRSGLILE